MPVFSRKQLRRDIGYDFTHDLRPVVGNTQGASFGQFDQTDWFVSNVLHSNRAASGMNLYQNAWVFVEGSTANADTSNTFHEYMVASFNCGSGAYIIQMPSWEYVDVNSFFELHTRVSPEDKNRAIDDTIKRIRIKQEVGITSIDGALSYTIDGAASPFVIDRILDMHISADPSNSLNIDLRHISDWKIVSTATGNLLRLQYAVQGSQQIIMECILIPSLGGEVATISVPDERWILAGAAMRCYDFMIQAAPAQQVAQLVQRRAEWSAEYARLSSLFQPDYAEPIRLHDVIRGAVGRPWSEPW